MVLKVVSAGIQGVQAVAVQHLIASEEIMTNELPVRLFKPVK